MAPKLAMSFAAAGPVRKVPADRRGSGAWDLKLVRGRRIPA
jgi:hypothetical protein